jgi:hypothetical protein
VCVCSVLPNFVRYFEQWVSLDDGSTGNGLEETAYSYEHSSSPLICDLTSCLNTVMYTCWIAVY